MIEAVIFDAEGVAVDTEDLWDEVQAELLRRRGVEYDRHRLKPLLTGRSARESAAALLEHHGLDEDLAAVVDERSRLMEELVEGTVTYVGGFRSFFSVVDAHYETCIATSMDDRLLGLIDDELDLLSLVGGRIVTVDDVGGVGKPDPAIFLAAASLLETDPERCVVVEDSPLGVEAAGRAGMRCIGLATTYPPELLAEADIVIESFARLDPVTLVPYRADGGAAAGSDTD